jgi:hypothetical protein
MSSNTGIPVIVFWVLVGIKLANAPSPLQACDGEWQLRFTFPIQLSSPEIVTKRFHQGCANVPTVGSISNMIWS